MLRVVFTVTLRPRGLGRCCRFASSPPSSGGKDVVAAENGVTPQKGDNAVAERPPPAFPTGYVTPKRTELGDTYQRTGYMPRFFYLARVAEETPSGRRSRWVKTILQIIAVLSAIVGYTAVRIHTSPEGEYIALNGTTHFLYLMVPFRGLSRLFGKLAEWEPPEVVRGVLFGALCTVLGIELGDAVGGSDPGEYKCFQDIFTRKLVRGARPVEEGALLCAPADGCLLRCGELYAMGSYDDWIPQVKGFHYKLEDFTRVRPSPVREGMKRVFAVVYLAPHNYHRFHVPADSWEVERQIHVPGTLFGVGPLWYKFIDELYCYNERVALTGTWKYGTLQYVIVGATNVGSIRLKNDSDFKTNLTEHSEITTSQMSSREHFVTEYKSRYSPGKAGDELGWFEMGSTVVVVADVPKEADWSIVEGTEMRVGESLMRLPPKPKGR
eukprot:Hpha_TRINITY_DN34458_c0_g1::TRINITY_DN34458_c0_g1_i1::g.96221::m.96221/K01613/psd, PISD; phosphatidylserine decarboxylase